MQRILMCVVSIRVAAHGECVYFLKNQQSLTSAIVTKYGLLVLGKLGGDENLRRERDRGFNLNEKANNNNNNREFHTGFPI